MLLCIEIFVSVMKLIRVVMDNGWLDSYSFNMVSIRVNGMFIMMSVDRMIDL